MGFAKIELVELPRIGVPGVSYLSLGSCDGSVLLMVDAVGGAVSRPDVSAMPNSTHGLGRKPSLVGTT